MVAYRSPVFDNVDPDLLKLIQSTASTYAPYKTNIISGYRAGDPRLHGRGKALDVELLDPKTGVKLPNYHDASQIGAYQQFANAVYNNASDEMKKRLRWGGYFSGGADKYGSFDPMHFDVGGDLGMGMLGGSWAGGFNPEQMKTWGIKDPGGIGGGQMGPAMPKAPQDYTPEQRRNAIAAIESVGSGDYGALGPWTGDPKEGRDRAYGRYQMMGKNIPVWSKQVLGREMTPDEFMKDPKAQDAIFDSVFGDYVKKHGEAGAANMWFTGHPDSIGRKDAFGTTDTSYEARYLKGLGAPVAGANYPTPNASSTGASTGVASAGAGAIAGAPAPDDRSGLATDLTSSLGAALGKGSGGPVVQPSIYTPTATTTASEAINPFNVNKAQASRDQLAMAMARLNSGKLWAG